jgi:hypothetical protein
MSTKKQKKPATRVSADAFVRAWMTSKTAAEVSKRTGLPVHTVGVRAAQLRKRGVRLPLMGVGRKPLDIDALNAIVDGAKKS